MHEITTFIAWAFSMLVPLSAAPKDPRTMNHQAAKRDFVVEHGEHIDEFAFSRPEPVPPRLDLKTGVMRVLTPGQCRSRGAKIPGGAATVLDLPLDATKELRSLTLRTLGNEVVIGLMAVTLERVD